MFDGIFDAVIFIVTVSLVGFSIYAYVRKFLLSLKGRKTVMRELEAPIKNPITQTMQARVVSKRADTLYSGNPRYPKHELKFFITFKVSGGKADEYEVSEKLFKHLKVGENGTLIIVNGEFFNFEIR